MQYVGGHYRGRKQTNLWNSHNMFFSPTERHQKREVLTSYSITVSFDQCVPPDTLGLRKHWQWQYTHFFATRALKSIATQHAFTTNDKRPRCRWRSRSGWELKLLHWAQEQSPRVFVHFLCSNQLITPFHKTTRCSDGGNRSQRPLTPAKVDFPGSFSVEPQHLKEVDINWTASGSMCCCETKRPPST